MAVETAADEAAELARFLEAVADRYGYDLRGYAPDVAAAAGGRDAPPVGHPELARAGAKDLGRSRPLHARARQPHGAGQRDVPRSHVLSGVSGARRSVAAAQRRTSTYGTRAVRPAKRSTRPPSSSPRKDFSIAARSTRPTSAPARSRMRKLGVYAADGLARFAGHYRAAGGALDLARYATEAYGRVSFHESLRGKVLFFQHDLVGDHVFAEMDVIFCRNVMIYFGRALKERVLTQAGRRDAAGRVPLPRTKRAPGGRRAAAVHRLRPERTNLPRRSAVMTELRPKVLLVDDVEANLVALEGILGRMPCDLVRAGSGNEALRLLLKEEFAVMLLDVQMPDMDGYEVAQHARDNPETRHVPIIFVTATHATEESILRGYDTGAFDLLFKPIDPYILRSKVQVFLDLYLGRRRLQAEIAAHKQTLAEVEAFNYSVSHDLRAPLRPLDGFSEVLLEDYGDKLDDRGRNYLTRIRAAAQRMGQLIDDLLELSRVSRADLRRQQLDLSALVRRHRRGDSGGSGGRRAGGHLHARSSGERGRTSPAHRAREPAAQRLEVHRSPGAAPDRVWLHGGGRGADLLRPRQRCGVRPHLCEQAVPAFPAAAHRRVRWHRDRPRHRRQDHSPTRGADLGRVRAGPGRDVFLHAVGTLSSVRLSDVAAPPRRLTPIVDRTIEGRSQVAHGAVAYLTLEHPRCGPFERRGSSIGTGLFTRDAISPHHLAEFPLFKGEFTRRAHFRNPRSSSPSRNCNRTTYPSVR